MIDPALTSRLEEIYRVVKNSFVRYIIESSEAEIRSDFDRRALAGIDGWDRESRRLQGAILAALRAEDVQPLEGAYPLDFSQFNFLSPTYLLGQAIDRGRAELERMEMLGYELGAWPQAQSIVFGGVAQLRLHLGKLRRLQLEKPVEPPPVRRVKGTSASRW